MVSTGTKADERKVKGKTTKNISPIRRSSALRTDAPMNAATHEKPKANPATMNGTSLRSRARSRRGIRMPMMYPTASMRQATNRLTKVARPATRPPSDAPINGHGERSVAVNHAFLEVFGESDAGLSSAEEGRLDEDAGHQEVDVVEVSPPWGWHRRRRS